jgi:hypothetical protein
MFSGGVATQQLTTVGAPAPPTPPPGATVSQQPQSRAGLTACICACACVRARISPIGFHVPEPIFMKLGMYVMAPEPI